MPSFERQRASENLRHLQVGGENQYNHFGEPAVWKKV
jgi:hypothetical protein